MSNRSFGKSRLFFGLFFLFCWALVFFFYCKRSFVCFSHFYSRFFLGFLLLFWCFKVSLKTLRVSPFFPSSFFFELFLFDFFFQFLHYYCFILCFQIVQSVQLFQYICFSFFGFANFWFVRISIVWYFIVRARLKIVLPRREMILKH